MPARRIRAVCERNARPKARLTFESFVRAEESWVHRLVLRRRARFQSRCRKAAAWECALGRQQSLFVLQPKACRHSEHSLSPAVGCRMNPWLAALTRGGSQAIRRG